MLKDSRRGGKKAIIFIISAIQLFTDSQDKQWKPEDNGTVSVWAETLPGKILQQG